MADDDRPGALEPGDDLTEYDSPEELEIDDANDSSERRYGSLSEAFNDMKFDLDNQAFIRRFAESLDVEGIYGRSGYLKLVRVSEGPALQVHRGYTNGFRSEEEIRHLLPDAHVWRSQRIKGTFGVTHPVHGPMRGDGSRARKPVPQKPCPNCGDLMPLSGICDNCG